MLMGCGVEGWSERSGRVESRREVVKGSGGGLAWKVGSIYTKVLIQPKTAKTCKLYRTLGTKISFSANQMLLSYCIFVSSQFLQQDLLQGFSNYFLLIGCRWRLASPEISVASRARSFGEREAQRGAVEAFQP